MRSSKKLPSRLGVVVSLATAALLPLATAHAQSHPEYVPLGRAKGALYRPDTGQARVGILLTHRTSNFLSHPACREFATRGFVVLCMNGRFDNNEVQVRFEEIALDVKAGVEHLRRQPGITKVVLFGHSGGGPTTSFYQAVAEAGIGFCKEERKLTRCGDELAGLPPADGMVFADAHAGNPVFVLRGLNPSVRDEQNPPGPPDPALDPFDPRNGYNTNGATHYSPDFQARYFAAQSARMNRLIDHALDIERRMKEGSYPYPDNDILLIPRGGNPGPGLRGSAMLFALDPSITGLMSTKAPRKLLKNDGTVSTQVIRSVLLPDHLIRDTNLSFDVGTKQFSIKSFLSANAIRSTNALDGINYCSTNNSTICAVQSISVPVLFTAMGGSVFIRDNELAYEVARSPDKDFVVIEGATHSAFTPCTECVQPKESYSNSVKNLFDYAARWINERF
jgi:hypothetical protein